MTLTPIAERFAVDLSLPVFTTKVCRSWDSNTQPSSCGANVITHCAKAAAFKTSGDSSTANRSAICVSVMGPHSYQMSENFSSGTKRKKPGSSKAPNNAPVNGGAYHARNKVHIGKVIKFICSYIIVLRTKKKNPEEMARAVSCLLIDPYPPLSCSKSCE